MSTIEQRRQQLRRYIYNNFEQVYPQDWTLGQCTDFVKAHQGNLDEIVNQKFD
ncbi:hypothetical protein NONI108955_11110 [Nocardia ninae]|uniref:hypothetical protein n=1 Tax=Nocardia ninae TaxID=356145 RepID=UPI0039EF1662